LENHFPDVEFTLMPCAVMRFSAMCTFRGDSPPQDVVEKDFLHNTLDLAEQGVSSEFLVVLG